MTEPYKSVELQTNVPGVGYSLKHRAVVKALTIHFCKRAVGKRYGNGQVFTQRDYEIMHNRAKCHDMDKILGGLSYPQLMADYFHRLLNGHHLESAIDPESKSKYDWMEMMFDCESAKYTKPDKQSGGAYAFLRQFRSDYLCFLEPYFRLFGLDKPDTGFIPEIQEIARAKVYETDLVEAFLEYIHTTRLHELDAVARIDSLGYAIKFNQNTPYRRCGKGAPVYSRPNSVAQQYNSARKLELVNGSIEAQMFDMDQICLLNKDQTRVINAQALEVVKQLKASDLHR